MRQESFDTGQGPLSRAGGQRARGPAKSAGTACGGRAEGAWERAESALGDAVSAVESARTADVALMDAVGKVYSNTVAHLQQRVDEGEPGILRPCDAPVIVTEEVVAATGEAPARIGHLVGLVASDPERVVCGREALVEGRASLSRVLTWFADTRHLQADDAVAIGLAVLTRAADGSPRSSASFRELLRRRIRKVEAADRQAARERMAQAIQGRGSWTHPGDDGTGSLTVVGEATRVAAAWGRLDAAARRAKAAGDQRTLSQLRSDIHLDLLLVGQLPSTCTNPQHTSPTTKPGSTPSDSAPGGAFTRPSLPTPAVDEPQAAAPPQTQTPEGTTNDKPQIEAQTGAETPTGVGTRPPVPVAPEPGSPEPPAPPVCTSCGTVSDDWFPVPQVGDPVLPPARVTVVVGLDVLLENADTTINGTSVPTTGPPGGTSPPSSGPPGSASPPGGRPPGDEPPGQRPPNTQTTDALDTPGDRGAPADDAAPGDGGAHRGLRGAALGWMPGFGYLDPEHVRAVATREGSVWQRLVADPTTGHAVSVSPYTYRPTASVARFVRARDGIARDPGSGVSAQQCELDHVIPFDEGGPTTPGNLQCLSRRGHTRKTTRGWHATITDDGTVHWTTLLGQTHTTQPHDYTDQ
ncbi:HNH endonuclease [Kytococcus sedentarius]|uniref:HNH endonuclease n=1 Tax=Kytococcus sedentarius TaxID=1276 RepID=UPI0035BC7959